MSSDLKKDIIDAIEDIDDIFTKYELLFANVKQHIPDNIELAALGTVLHSFYNGVEGIFLLVAKHFDNNIPGGLTWHQSLLNQMVTATGTRGRLISPDTASILAAYLKFRHFFRHAYSFMLDWVHLKQLTEDLDSVWVTVRKDIVAFCDSLPS